MLKYLYFWCYKGSSDCRWIDRDKCEAVETFIQEWLDLGVRYVGGCCRTYAADMSRIRNQVQSWRDRRRFQAKYQANINATN